MTIINVQLLLTGNELMTGDIIDSNSVMIAQDLKELGVEIKRKVTVADRLQDLVDEINHMSKLADVIIMNGGLGPTTDDLTAQALSLATNSPLIEHPEALSHLEKWCQFRNVKLSKANLKQALLPNGCIIIANRMGSAVGFKLLHNNCEIYCTPGVPSELKVMLNEEIVPDLRIKIPPQAMTNITRLQVFGIGESNLQSLIIEKFPDWPKDIEIGYRVEMPTVEVKLISHSPTALVLKDLWLKKLSIALGDHIVSVIQSQPLTLAEHVLILLKEKKLKITTAESCTGGLIASQLTAIAGASENFEAGFVTYSNKMKTEILSVSQELINENGAVSEQTVVAMAQGALKRSKANFVIAVSGIAGPDGGTIEKPVGSVWIAWGTHKEIYTQYFCIPSNRKQFQHMVAALSLDLIRRLLLKSTQTPFYIQTP